jgi:predicted O-methyltransferase YrrM
VTLIPSVRDIAGVVKQAVAAIRRDRSADAAAQLALRALGPAAGIEFPREFLELVCALIGPVSHRVAVLRRADGSRLDYFTSRWCPNMPPLPISLAVEIARDADRFRANLTGFERPVFGFFDVSDHFAASSSLGRKGRLLANLVRAHRPRRCIELGTGYGISSRLIVETQLRLGLAPQFTTVENFSPQKELSRELLARRHGDGVQLVHGRVAEVLSAMPTDAAARFDFAFHDAAHTGDAFVEDFAALLPRLNAGAIAMIDDIRFPPRPGSKRTSYEAWREIAAHPNVLCAAEIDRQIGVVQLRADPEPAVRS